MKRTQVLYLIVQILSGLLTILSLVGVFLAKEDEMKSQYLFNFSQFILMFAVAFVPMILKKNIRLVIPQVLQIVFLIFCICHFFLGEVGEFYLHVKHWDSILHFIGGIVTAIFGFCIVGILNKTDNSGLKLSPVFIAIFAVCFTISIGVIWEVYEFGSDIILGTNMQRYMDSVTGELFIGKEALKDTMKDLILESLSAVAVAIVFIFNESFRDIMEKNKIQRLTKEEMIQEKISAK